MTQPAAQSQNKGAAWKFLRLAAGLALLYYAWLMFDLFIHPFNPGANAVPIPYLFRWLSAVCGTYTVVVAVFILRRIPGSTIGFLLLIIGVGAAGWSQRTDFGSLQVTGLVIIVFNLYFYVFAFPAYSALLFHFPSGQIYPAGMKGWAWVFVIFQAAAGVLTNLGIPAYQNGLITNPTYIPALLPYAALFNWFAFAITPLVGVIFLVIRFRNGSERERLQIKWLVYLAAVASMISILEGILIPDTPSQPMNLGIQLARIFGFLFWQVYPAAAIGIALLRYRLWDIDILIRRTLVYGLLSGLLGLVYFGSVVLLRQVLGGLTGNSSPALVLSTLLIAALFSPLRRRLQQVIDRRFYRQKYDAERAMADFSNTARGEVDQDALTAKLTSIVVETVQPENLSLWVRKGQIR